MAHNLTLGIIGLGRMGRQIARRLHKKGFRVLAWNRSPGPRELLNKFFGGTGTAPTIPSPPSPPKSGEKNERRGGASAVFETIPSLIQALPKPRIIWMMLPAGELLDEFLFGKNGLRNLLARRSLGAGGSKGDIIIDGGNSFYQDTIHRAKILAKRGIHFFDCGTSGGIHGEKNGFSLMVGGEKKIFKKVEPVFRALAAPSSPPSLGEGRARERLHYGLVGPSGAGHFVKMVHNGIEYGMMEAIAEGFAVINKWNSKINLAEVARIWEKGAVVSSWLISLARDIFEKENLAEYAGLVQHTGEGEWTIKEAKKLGVDVQVIEDAFKIRLESSKKKNQNKFSNKVVALLRNQFGGHSVLRKK